MFNLTIKHETWWQQWMLHCKDINGFSFSTAEEARMTKEIIDKFETYVVGGINETYEQFVFTNRIQLENETFDEFYLP